MAGRIEDLMHKFDAKKDLKPLYTAPVGGFVVLDVPPARYLMVDGRGDPNVEPRYGEAVQALYAASHTLKFMSKDISAGTPSCRPSKACGGPTTTPTSSRAGRKAGPGP